MTDTTATADVARLDQLAVALRTAVERELERLSAAGPEDREAAAASLELAAAIGRVEQVAHGLHLQALAHADRVKAARGGIGPWLAARQGYAKSHARSLAQDARLLASVPDLAPHLSAGALTADATRLLARTVKACKDTSIDPAAETHVILHHVQVDGVSAAAERVRELEHRLDPDKAKTEHERHRRRSKAGSCRLESGLWRFEILLDPARAAVLKTALDALSAHWMRVNGRDGIKILPEDVKTTEQITAHAFHHLAKVFLAAPTHLREAAFTPPVIFTAPLPDIDTESTVPNGTGPMQNPVLSAATIGAVRDPVSGTVAAACTSKGLDDGIPHGCALSAYDDVIPLTAVTRTPLSPRSPLRDPARLQDPSRLHDRARRHDRVPLQDPVGPADRACHRILHYDCEGRPVLLDGQHIDQDPHARLAIPAQRTALAIRDRTCTHAGCDRPFVWSLEAHHLIPYSAGGPTTLANLATLCAEHHRALHDPE